MRAVVIVPTLLCCVLTAASSARSCPLCDAGTGEQVRAGLFDGNLGMNLVAILSPFVVVLTIVAMIHCGWPKKRRLGPHVRNRNDP